MPRKVSTQYGGPRPKKVLVVFGFWSDLYKEANSGFGNPKIRTKKLGEVFVATKLRWWPTITGGFGKIRAYKI